MLASRVSHPHSAEGEAVCYTRRKSLALRFDEPLSDVQLDWLAAGPAAVRSLCFGPGEQRAFRVCGQMLLAECVFSPTILLWC